MTWLINLLSGGAGAAIGRAASNLGAAALLAPLGVWFLAERDHQAVEILWWQAAIAVVLVAALLKVAHYTPAPARLELEGRGAELVARLVNVTIVVVLVLAL